MAEGKGRGKKDNELSYSNKEFAQKLGKTNRGLQNLTEKFIVNYKLDKTALKKNNEVMDDFNWDILWAELAKILIKTSSQNPFYDHRKTSSLDTLKASNVQKYHQILQEGINKLPEHLRRLIISTDSYYLSRSLVDHIPMLIDKIYELIITIFVCSSVDGGDVLKYLLDRIDNLICDFSEYYNIKSIADEERMEQLKEQMKKTSKETRVFDFQKSSLDVLMVEILKYLLNNEIEQKDSKKNSDLSEGMENIEERRAIYYALMNDDIYIPRNLEETAIIRNEKYRPYQSKLERNEEDIRKFNSYSRDKKIEEFESRKKNTIEDYRNRIKRYEAKIEEIESLEYTEDEDSEMNQLQAIHDFYIGLQKLKRSSKYKNIEKSVDLMLGQALLAFLGKDNIEKLY